MIRRADGPSPYAALTYPHIRELHDWIYFGRWRGLSGTDADLEQVWQQLQEYVKLLEAEVGPDAPSDQRDYLGRARSALALSDPRTNHGSELFQAINATLSYGHSVLNLLLRSRGEASHVSRDFALYYDSAGNVDE
ncbi:MAG: hypothetical protein HY574_13895 [candidate division NC10 bacterium]|nr:hypothetical protein [candidate division NC10 bacterium]